MPACVRDESYGPARMWSALGSVCGSDLGSDLVNVLFPSQIKEMREVVPRAHLQAVAIQRKVMGVSRWSCSASRTLRGSPLGKAPSAFGLSLCLFNSWASKRAARLASSQRLARDRAYRRAERLFDLAADLGSPERRDANLGVAICEILRLHRCVTSPCVLRILFGRALRLRKVRAHPKPDRPVTISAACARAKDTSDSCRQPPLCPGFWPGPLPYHSLITVHCVFRTHGAGGN